MNKKIVQKEFGENAEAYVISKTHAKGKSLAVLVERVQPEKNWQALDIATGAGHTAFAFAPFVQHIWATDITSEMLATVDRLAAEKNVENITTEYAEAENLPFEDGFFNLVTCRIAAHHFSDIPAFLRETARVLHPGGIFALVDNVVPPGAAGAYVNAFEKLRDPSHGRCLGVDEWRTDVAAAGLSDIHNEIIEKSVHFEFWAQRHDLATQGFLRSMLGMASGEAQAFLHPYRDHEGTHFHLQEILLTARKPGPSV